MNVKTPEKRDLKAYKIKGSIYKKAMRRAKKEKVFLANLIEEFVGMYANGYSVKYQFDFGKVSEDNPSTQKEA